MKFNLYNALSKITLLLFLAVVICTQYTNAKIVQSGGIYYMTASSDGTAKVVSKPKFSYSGDIIIPARIVDDNIKYSVTEIANDAFKECDKLRSVIIPNSVIMIGERAFKGCSNLNNIEIPNSVISICESAFEDCNSFISIEIPQSVKFVGENAFKNCMNLLNVEIFESNKIQSNAFPVHTIITWHKDNYLWEDFSKDLLTWEQYYNKNKKIDLPFTDQNSFKIFINKEIEKWQMKGEFESTEQWKMRVNEKSRQEKAAELKDYYLEVYKNDKEKMIQEQQELSASYELYKNILLERFYKNRTLIAKKEFKNARIDLMPYDADHSTFLIHSDKFGDILLPVPLTEAKSFKENWNDVKRGIIAEFVPNGKDVALSKVIFNYNSKEYIYDSHTIANYTITDVKYNFAPIELSEEINFDGINVEELRAIPQKSSSLVGINNAEAIAANNVQVEKINIVASNKSNVDEAIPQNKTDNNTTTFAIIIANENYHSVSNVPYAFKDGEILEKYLTRAVGLPKEHVKFYKNASFGNMAAAIKHIENLSEAFGSELNLIIYYAGHGMPSEKTKNPMLIPVDGDPAIPETCYELNKVITTLGSLNANSVVIMLDACFSGTERGDGMLMAARGIKIKSNRSEPIGNMIILSATQEDETAYPFELEQHGLFTYFLLKKIQENKGNVTLGELSDYITEQVKRQSVVSNGKLQTPTVSVSSSMKDIWRSIPLR